MSQFALYFAAISALRIAVLNWQVGRHARIVTGAYELVQSGLRRATVYCDILRVAGFSGIID